MSFGPGELLVLGVVIVVIFSAARMGAIGNALGKFVYSFKRASRGEDTVDVTPRSGGKLGRTPPPEDGQIIEDPRAKKR